MGRTYYDWGASCYREIVDRDKPPVGLRPRRVWVAERVQEIVEAMGRYTEAKVAIPSEWVKELGELVAEQQAS